MEFELKAVADALGLTLESEARVIVGRDARVIVGSDARVTGWSIDSRTVAPGDLFFALRGPNHDGNAFVGEVLRKGAVAAIANDIQLGPVLIVPDTLGALQSTA